MPNEIYFRTKEVLVIDMPDAGQTTSVAFGGPKLDILYVTSAATDRSAQQPKLAGSVFQIKGLAQGILPYTLTLN